MITLATIFTLSINILLVGNNIPVVNADLNSNYTLLAPSAPVEATFEDNAVADLSTFAPVAPREADFPDAPETTNDYSYLAPIAPAEADFSTDEILVCLSPVTPAVADFPDAF